MWGGGPSGNLDAVYFAQMLNDEVTVSHRRCRTLDRELLTDGEFYEFSAMRPKMHKHGIYRCNPSRSRLAKIEL